MTFILAEYPHNWRSFYRPYCLRRAGERRDPSGSVLVEAQCEWCSAENHAGKVFLTIAHLDHDHLNPMPSLQRLAALCPSCHNAYDMLTRRSRRLTRMDRSSGQLRLFS